MQVVVMSNLRQELRKLASDARVGYAIGTSSGFAFCRAIERESFLLTESPELPSILEPRSLPIFLGR
jgi:hypothetical protein